MCIMTKQTFSEAKDGYTLIETTPAVKHAIVAWTRAAETRRLDVGVQFKRRFPVLKSTFGEFILFSISLVILVFRMSTSQCEFFYVCMIETYRGIVYTRKFNFSSIPMPPDAPPQNSIQRANLRLRFDCAKVKKTRTSHWLCTSPVYN